MPTIYISDSGDDKNDGLSLRTAIYSLERAEKLGGGMNDCSRHFGPRAWKRIKRSFQRRISARCRSAFKGAPVRRVAVTMDRRCWWGLGGGVGAFLV